jgi:hypothetical protein
VSSFHFSLVFFILQLVIVLFPLYDPAASGGPTENDLIFREWSA